MSAPEIKKRHVHGVNTSTIETHTTQPTAGARTTTWHEISEWQRDNKYILSGYRPEKADYLEILSSLTFLHNETCNVYTHLVGALLLPLVAAAVFTHLLSEPRFLDVARMDYAMFGVFFLCAECCLIFSATYHLLGPHSQDVEQFWHRADLLGIVVVTVGTFVPGIYYIFSCEPGLQNLHWAFVSRSERIASSARSLQPGLMLIMLICILEYSLGLRHRCSDLDTQVQNAALAEGEGERIRRARCISVHPSTAWSPAVRARVHAPVYGNEMVSTGAYCLWWWSWSLRGKLANLATPFFPLANRGRSDLTGNLQSRIPERFAPGKFDIWGSSHQIFHVSILCAMYINVIALMQAFTACHTLNLCSIQAAHQASNL